MKTILIPLLAMILAESPPPPTLTGPTECEVGESVWLDIEGVSVADMRTSTINVFPDGSSVEYRVFVDIMTGNPAIWFEANEVGEFDVQVIVPSCSIPEVPQQDEFTRDEVLQLMDGIEPTFIELKWKIVAGGGPNPPPPTPVPPIPPDPPEEDETTEGPLWSITMANPTRISADDQEVMLEINEFCDLKTNVRRLQLSPDSQQADGTQDPLASSVADAIKKKGGDPNEPWIALVQKVKGKEESMIHSLQELPSRPEQITGEIETILSLQEN